MRKFLRWVLGGSAILYPLLMHVLIVHGMIDAALVGLLVVSLTACMVYATESRAWFPAFCFGCIALAALLGLKYGQAFALYLSPVAINLVFASIFGSTLRARETPLIERFMRLHHGSEVPPAKVRYARRLTLLWTIFFFSMALVASLLALFASMEAWSLFANVVNYLLVAALFLGQFLYSYLRYGTPRLLDIVPTAIRVARRAAGNTSIGR